VKEERSGKVAPVLATEDHTQRPGEEECKLEAQTAMRSSESLSHSGYLQAQLGAPR